VTSDPITAGLSQETGVLLDDDHITDTVMLYKCLGKISDILYLNNENNQLKRRAWPPKDVPLDA